MNRKIAAVVTLLTIFNLYTYCQLTDVEKSPRAQSADTIIGTNKLSLKSL
jgi:hypothetical protein